MAEITKIRLKPKLFQIPLYQQHVYAILVWEEDKKMGDNRINQYCGNCGNLWDFCECYEGLDLDEMKKQYNDITFEDVEGDIELTEEEE